MVRSASENERQKKRLARPYDCMATINGWYKPNVQTTIVTVRSQLYDLPLHYVDSRGRNARCIGEDCRLCELYELKPHYAAVVQLPFSKQLKLLEFSRQHAEVVEFLESLAVEIVGQELAVCRRIRKDAIELSYEPSGRREATPIIAANYVRAIGVKEYIRAVDSLQLDLSG